MKYRPPIISNDFIPHAPDHEEWFEIVQQKCINCGRPYDGKDIIFAILADGRLIYWHRFNCEHMNVTKQDFVENIKRIADHKRSVQYFKKPQKIFIPEVKIDVDEDIKIVKEEDDEWF